MWLLGSRGDCRELPKNRCYARKPATGAIPRPAEDFFRDVEKIRRGFKDVNYRKQPCHQELNVLRRVLAYSVSLKIRCSRLSREKEYYHEKNY